MRFLIVLLFFFQLELDIRFSLLFGGGTMAKKDNRTHMVVTAVVIASIRKA
jgi:hypothetical protein